MDPPESRPTTGYGFITPLNPTSYGAPDKYYFHMSEIETPDEYGGIEPGTGVSFVITPARSGKGVQAVAVTIADPPKENKENQDPTHGSFGALKIADANGFGDDAQGGGWGTEDTFAGGGWGTADTTEGGAWGTADTADGGGWGTTDTTEGATSTWGN